MLRNGWDGQEILIHSETMGRRLLKAQISKSVGAYDMFSGTIDSTNIGYDKLLPLQTFIRVIRPDKKRVLFEGRLLTVQPSMSKDGVINKDFSCEALDSFLHDSYQPWAEFHDTSPKAFMQALINQHNLQVENYKKIKLGTVTVTNSTDNVYRFSDDTKDTYDNIKGKLLDSLGGELRIRNEIDGLYLDYEPEISEQSNQVIRLQSNLLSITQKIDPTEIITMLKPLGKAAERTAEGTDTTQAVSSPRLTIASVNNGSVFIRDEKLISQFGIQTGVKTWDGVTTATVLMTNGTAFMASQKTINQQVQISAVDLSLINRSIDDFVCGNYQHIINPLMAFDQILRIVSQSIDICAPSSSTMSVGDVLMSQEAYNRELKKQAQLGNQINERVQLLDTRTSILAKDASAAQKTIEQLTTTIGEFQAELSAADVTGINTSLATMQNQLTTIYNNIGELGTEVLANQKVISGLQAADSAIKQRLTALETPTGGTTK